MKKLYIGTNLKMYKTIAQTVNYLRELGSLTDGINREKLCLFVIPSYTSLQSAVSVAAQSRILLGAQNMHWEEQGQFTGEISPLMLDELGIDIIEIGHSERRHVFGETDEHCNKKVLSALAHGFVPLLCVGETAQQKDNGVSDEILRIQIKIGLLGVEPEQLQKLWVAYEPVWSIGVSGIPAPPEYAQEKHKVIRAVLRELYGHAADEVPILYGGSVNPDNFRALISQPEVNGLFVGRAAWEAEKFNILIRETLPVWEQKHI